MELDFNIGNLPLVIISHFYSIDLKHWFSKQVPEKYA